MRALIALQLAVALAACTRTSGYWDPQPDASAQLDAATDGSAPDWPATGARMTNAVFVRPEALRPGCDINPCPTRVDMKLVLRARSTAGGVGVRGGVVASVTDGGVGVRFADRLTPATVLADVEAPYAGDAGTRRPFATVAPVLWDFEFAVGQPSLPIRKTVISGSLDATGLPTSSDPRMGGKVEGCFTRQDAERIYIAVLSQTLEELIESSGGQVDVDCTGSGTLDGYALELSFEGEAIELQE
jgi:hypothetical protein